ncbi:MAG: response regulator [Proteobacteria bacterium]|jgi:CheY-like chemotaxis protein|nr:response regulator [Alphaproteobacteria bacterium]NCC02629.1 response regulator [Pseudomonadota bacterium]
MTKSNSNEIKQVRILVAEDNPAVREFVVRALKTDDRKIVDVEDGQQALAALNQEPFDVLIADIVMPNLDGIALALKASRQYPDLRIIMISGYAQERMRAHNLDALVHRIIAKPFSLEEISEAVQDVLALPPDGN